MGSGDKTDDAKPHDPTITVSPVDELLAGLPDGSLLSGSAVAENVAEDSNISGTSASNYALTEQEYRYLFSLFQIYTNVQVQADTIYHNRTSIITLTEGFLFLAYQAALQNIGYGTKTLSMGIAVIGIILSLLWLLFEQRNAIYFEGRGTVLIELETILKNSSKEAKTAFYPFWSEVPKWVRKNAKWYQRVSAPLILRVIVPLLFVCSWIFIMIVTQFIIFPSTKLANSSSAPVLSKPSSDNSDLDSNKSITPAAAPALHGTPDSKPQLETGHHPPDKMNKRKNK